MNAPSPAPSGGTGSPGVPVPQRYWAVAAILASITLSVLDGSIVQVALPVIAHALAVTPAESVRVVNAYQLTLAAGLIPFAALGDVLGYRRVFRVALVVFGVASAGCAAATTLDALTLARAIQGLGAAALIGSTGALTRVVYPAEKFGRGIGLNATVVASSSALGPSVAALILAHAPWNWLFWVNVPIATIAFAIAWRTLPDNRRTPNAYDWKSALFSALTVATMLFGVESIGQRAPPLVSVAILALAFTLGTAYVRMQLRQPAPLLPVDLLARPAIALSVGAGLLNFVGQMLVFVLLPFQMVRTYGFTIGEAGLVMTAWPATVACIASFSGRLADRGGSAKIGAAGLLVAATGLFLLLALPESPAPLDIAWRLALAGAGVGLFQPPNVRLVLSAAPLERSGAVGSIMPTARLIGQTLGASFAAMLLGIASSNAFVIAVAIAGTLMLVSAAMTAVKSAGGA